MSAEQDGVSADFREELRRATAELSHLRHAFENVSADVEQQQHRLNSIIETIGTEVTKALDRKVKRLATIGSSVFILLLLSLWTAMWNVSSFRIGFLDFINSALKFDDYLAFKINEDQIVRSDDPHTPLRTALSHHTLTTLGDRYPTYEDFDKLVALSFPIKTRIRYKRNIESQHRIRFYSSPTDHPYLICELLFRGPAWPRKILFNLNNREQKLLTLTFTTKPVYKLFHRQLDTTNNNPSFSLAGLHELLMRVILDPGNTNIREFSDADIQQSWLDTDCLIAVVGRADASRLVPR